MLGKIFNALRKPLNITLLLAALAAFFNVYFYLGGQGWTRSEKTRRRPFHGWQFGRII